MGSDGLFREQYREYLGVETEEESEEELLAKALALSLEDNDDNSNGKVKNILLIGRTGSGKSTLGNVLVGKEETFKESSGSISETKRIKTEKFTLNISKDGREKVDYLVIDTIGFGDTQLETKEILELLTELVPVIKKNGLNQILFVNRGRFSKEEIDTYKILTSVLFDENAAKYTTIVRTRFPKFESQSACESDRQKLQGENQEISEILKTSKIIYVDNPPLEGREKVVDLAKETREESRKRLLTHLGTYQKNYYPSNLEKLTQRVDNYITREQELQGEIEAKEQIIHEEEVRLQKEMDTLKKEKERDLRITGRNFERQVQELQTQSQKKIQATRQELGEVHQERLQNSQQTYDREVNRLNQTIQSNLSTIRSNYNNVRVGEPVCSRGHDYNIQTYDRSGYLIPDSRTGFIGHIYCPTCGSSDYNYTLRNATTYTLEE
ncbi:P-loop containing nucleoside triphosphate hydrolase protein [Glomus cerebriforme]|uniref:P-loop containing nucleoside triphosphate hydrolase protein n=1 Tax=Glomus cerebriforme TaxID=658196 RepID=A0A397SJV3_9GLOM|nr:P-loop containing nucleoside triphosphate hydrolase protein [Glomus cerebriforme]